MNKYEQIIKQIIETSPSWEKDGGGVRGRTLAPLIGGASGPNLMGDPIPQQFNQQRRELIQQQDDPVAKLNLPSIGGGGGGVIPPHPWQVLLRAVPDTDPVEYEYRVDLNSTLYSSLGSFSNIAVTGLDFWAPASTGYLYLFGVVSNGVCTEASIQGPEAIPSDRIDFVGGIQNSFSAIIAYLYGDGAGGIAVQQRAFHNFTLINSCVNGNAAIYPIAT